MAKIFAIATNKGGVLKTTLTVNLGAELSKKHRVLLLDTDPQSNVAGTFGIIESEVPATLYDCLARNKNLKEAIINVSVNLDIVYTGKEMNSFAGENPDNGSKISPLRVKELIDSVRDQYDYILVDTAPAQNSVTIQALLAVDEVIIPFHPEGYSVSSIVATLDAVTQIKDVTKKKLKVNSFVITKYESKSYTHKKVLNDIISVANRLGIRVISTKVPQTSSGGRSIVEEQKPTVLAKRWYKLKATYANVANEVFK